MSSRPQRNLHDGGGAIDDVYVAVDRASATRDVAAEAVDEATGDRDTLTSYVRRCFERCDDEPSRETMREALKSLIGVTLL